MNAMNPTPPSLNDLLQHPDWAGEIPPEAVPPLLIQISAVQTALAARLIGSVQPDSTQLSKTEPDTLLTAEQAAKILGVNKRWLHYHWKKLPFARRLSRKVLRFSENGIQRWNSVKRLDSSMACR